MRFKKFLVWLFVLFVLTLSIYAAYVYWIVPNFFPGTKIVHMIDPDSLIVMENGKLSLVQLIGVDAPELTGSAKGRQCYYETALSKAADYFNEQRSVSLSADGKAGEKDIYGRDLRYVYLGDGSLYNEKLLQDGIAKESNPENRDYKFKERFLQAQDEAKRDGKGLWYPDTCAGQF
jgi:micrococcal nuclease